MPQSNGIKVVLFDKAHPVPRELLEQYYAIYCDAFRDENPVSMKEIQENLREHPRGAEHGKDYLALAVNSTVTKPVVLGGGFFTYSKLSKSIWADLFAVAKSTRGAGIGSLLFRTAEHQLSGLHPDTKFLVSVRKSIQQRTHKEDSEKTLARAKFWDNLGLKTVVTPGQIVDSAGIHWDLIMKPLGTPARNELKTKDVAKVLVDMRKNPLVFKMARTGKRTGRQFLSTEGRQFLKTTFGMTDSKYLKMRATGITANLRKRLKRRKP